MIHDDPRIDLIAAQIEPLDAGATWRVAGLVAAHLVRRAKARCWRGLSSAKALACATSTFAVLSIVQAGLIVMLAWR